MRPDDKTHRFPAREVVPDCAGSGTAVATLAPQPCPACGWPCRAVDGAVEPHPDVRKLARAA